MDDLLLKVNEKLDQMEDYDSMKSFIEECKSNLNGLLAEKREKFRVYLVKISYDQFFEGQYDLSPWEHEEEKLTFNSLNEFFDYIKDEFGLEPGQILTSKQILKNKNSDLASLKHLNHINSRGYKDYSCQRCKDALDFFIAEIENKNSDLDILKRLNHIHSKKRKDCQRCKDALDFLIEGIKDEDLDPTILKHLNHISSKKHKEPCQRCEKSLDFFIEEIEDTDCNETISLDLFVKIIEDHMNYSDRYENFEIHFS